MKKPIIGIVTKHLALSRPRPDTIVRDEVKQAVFDHGGIAIGILTPTESQFDGDDLWHNPPLSDAEIAELLAPCDGVIFQGGAAYDDYETDLARYCYDHDLPTLGICCGQNALVRALNGQTFLLPNPEKHLRPDDSYVHEIKIVKNTLFSKIVGPSDLKVNSRHRRAVKTAPGLIVSARDDDGNIEVVEAPDKKFYLAMRFHPESLYRTDSRMSAIFKTFIKACERKK